MGELFESASAVISDCGRYRYRLERDGPGVGCTAIIMVNPSTADAENDDATIRKLKGFGARYGWGRIIVGNLFAYRATNVRDLASASDPIGPENDDHLRRMFYGAKQTIVAWGPVSKQPKFLRDRWRKVWENVECYPPILSIGEPAKCGHPKHPLMLAYSTPLIPWSPPEAAA